MTSTTRRTLACLLMPALTAGIAGCDRAGGAPQKERAEAPSTQRPLDVETAEESLDVDYLPLDVVGRLERLRALGRFEEFIDGALLAAAAQPDNAALLLQTSEALLASGRTSECELAAGRAAVLACDSAEFNLSNQALKVWAAARFRQGKPLNDPLLTELFPKFPPDDAGLETLRSWHEFLQDRPPFRNDSGATDPVELKSADVPRGTIPFELGAIEARANGVLMPLVFIDTGAQHTLMTADAARDAGVRIGNRGTQLTGFAGLVARPGVVETLELGDLVLHDVPVLVGESAPLVALDGQMSLGTELMHHVRFHIVYPARRVTAEAAHRAGAPELSPPIWDIPVWTFSQVCLARGQLAAGPMARVLVDTGNRAGTFVSYRWARRNLPQQRGDRSSLVFRFKKRNMTLDVLDLGSQTLSDWPVLDTMPPELDRLNLVDVILGHDLLWPYQLTIDLPGRVLQLRPGARPAADEGRSASSDVDDEAQ